MTTTMRAQNAHLTFKANLGVGRHGWVRITPAYGVRLVRAKVASLEPGSIVTDPFSGTGTTPLAAMEHGHHGQSLDVNPFLIWLGNAKMAHYNVLDLEECEETLAAVLKAARDREREPDLWQPKLFKIERWWSAGSLQALRALSSAMDDCLSAGKSSDLLRIAFCRVLISCSNAAFNHQSMSFKEAPAVVDALFDVSDLSRTLETFATEAQAILANAHQDLPGSGTVYADDSRTMQCELQLADLLLTSPPYANRMSYIRELRPYMYWLKYLDAASDAGALDWTAIGGTWGTATSKLNTWRPSQTGTPIDEQMDDVRTHIVQDGGKNGRLLSNYVGKYFDDMWAHFQATLSHVKPGGAVSYIIGNSTFYGHVVPAQDWYATMLREVGYTQVSVETIRKRNSNKQLYEYDVTGVRP
jgi:hypothetical protein